MVIHKMLGRVPELVAVMWHNQAVFKDMMGFGRKVEEWGRLDKNLASLAHMAFTPLERRVMEYAEAMCQTAREPLGSGRCFGLSTKESLRIGLRCCGSACVLHARAKIRA